MRRETLHSLTSRCDEHAVFRNVQLNEGLDIARTTWPSPLSELERNWNYLCSLFDFHCTDYVKQRHLERLLARQLLRSLRLTFIHIMI